MKLRKFNTGINLRGVFLLLLIALLVETSAFSQVKILYDATKAEMAGNADWVIDADVFNLGANSSGAMVTGRGNESNPQRFPTPDQSGVTSSTAETFWTGSLSSWAIDMVKLGYQVETLPYNGNITYGNAGNVQDLSNYKVFIVDEPNIIFSASEKTALMNFVQNGGGLFIVGDHDVSDRNGDGNDSPHIWNDFFTSNGVHANPFGMTFDYQDYSQTTSNVANIASDSCLHGPLGNATQMQISGGTTMTLSTADNATVRGLIYKTGASTTGTNNVFFARARYGNGKVCALGDSSPTDDGTGDTNDQLYTGYLQEAGGSHRKLLVNSTVWLAAGSTSMGIDNNETPGKLSLKIFPNPSHGKAYIQFEKETAGTVSYTIYDIYGKIINVSENISCSEGFNSIEINLPSAGFYIIRLAADNTIYTGTLVSQP